MWELQIQNGRMSGQQHAWERNGEGPGRESIVVLFRGELFCIKGTVTD